MRDALELEWGGVPSAVLIAEPLVAAAEAMKHVSGMPQYPYCVVQRPYSNLSQEEISGQVRRLAPRVIELLTKPAPSGTDSKVPVVIGRTGNESPA